MTEEELECAIASDSGSRLGECSPCRAPRKESVRLHVDADVLAWFRQQAGGYLTRMNPVLRAHMEAHYPRESL